MSIARAQDRLVGRALGEFVLRERIGEGGFGAVYRATQPALDREAVIKVLHGRLHASRSATDRFLREAKLASKLDHPYAAHIYAFGAEPDGELWIAMELVRGTPLDRILKVQGPIPLERFVPLLDRICEVVHTAHEQGIVHRDLKPANVMVLARAGRLLPKLLDFGIAKGLATEATPDTIGTDETLDRDAAPDLANANTVAPLGLTQRGAVIGSPPYMAPEQWLDAGQVDARTDLYALGILAYECLTGRPPFTGTTITAIAASHALEPVPPLGARFPAALDKVFAKVLAKDSQDRYPDVLAFVAAFRQASGVATEAATLPGLEPARRDAFVNGAPQPIAEAVAALDAARNAHQARDAIVQLARTITRYLGLLALACRSRVTSSDEPAAIHDLLRMFQRRSLSEGEWLELAHQLTRGWLDRRDAYPVPELVDAFQGDQAVPDKLSALLAIRDREIAGDAALLDLLEKSVSTVAHVLESLAFLAAYPLVVTVAGGVAERWMGVRRQQRTTMPVRGKALAVGHPALLDENGAPVLVLAPLVQIAAPTPGAPLELFLFEGRDARGGKLVSLPLGFEYHDEGVWDWLRAQLTGSFDDDEAAYAEEKAPYRGLSAFSAEDGALFFGREKQIDGFVNRLKVQPLLAVVGRSGAGKSSFVHAGVVPALGWRAIVMRPGASPLGALVARLEHAHIDAAIDDLRDGDRNALGSLLRADAAAHGPIVLVVDQLEEMFTLCQDADERRVFAEVVAAAARSPDDPVRVIFTLRDDFLLRTEQVPALRNRIGQGLQLLTVPGADDLKRILIEPARRVGYELEGDLAADMVKEVADQPGALALISFTASKLWELRDRHFKQLTRAAYRSLGGVGGALAHHADVTLEAMPAEERALTREAFRHLVTTQNTRAVLTRAELRQLLGGSEHADAVIEKLIAARLLVGSENESGAETIEIVHEALLAAWPRLVEWRREDAEGARFREQLRTAANQWNERDRAKGLLWRGDALADYTRWRARHPGPLTDAEAAFAAASLADAARGRRNRRALLVGAFAALGAGTAVFAVLTAQKKAQADELHDHLRDQYEDQGRRFVLADDPLRALAYLAKAAELGAHGAAHDFLVAQALQSTDGEILEVHHDNAVNKVELSADGTRLLTASDDRTVRVWDAQSGALVATLPHDAEVNQARYSADGRSALTASVDGNVVLWDLATQQPRHRWTGRGKLVTATLTPDDALVVTCRTTGEIAVSRAADGTPVFDAMLDRGLRACALSADGTMIAATDAQHSTKVWRIGEPAAIAELPGEHLIVAFSPDGSRVVTGDHEGAAIVWDVASGHSVQTLTHRGELRAISFSHDGRRILTASADRTAAVWDAATGAKQLTLTGHGAMVVTARFSPDETRIVTGSTDASAWLWDAASGAPLARWRGHQGRVVDVAFDRSAGVVVTAGNDGSAIEWRAVPQQRVVWVTHPQDSAKAAVFSPDGLRVVTAKTDGTATVSDSRTGRELVTLRGHRGIVWDAGVDPTGTSIATIGDDGTLRIWDAATGTQRAVWQTGFTMGADALAWSRDGQSIAVANTAGGLGCWDAATGKLRFSNHGHDGHPVYSVSFDSSSTSLITTGGDNTSRIWDLSGHERAHYVDADGPWAASFAPNATRILSVGKRKNARIWNTATGAVELDLVDDVGLTDAAWSPDGRFVIGAAVDSTARISDALHGDLLEIIPHEGEVFITRFSPDGTRVLLAGPRGVAVHELPQLHGDEDWARILRCRVPYEVAGDRLRPRVRDHRGC